MMNPCLRDRLGRGPLPLQHSKKFRNMEMGQACSQCLIRLDTLLSRRL